MSKVIDPETSFSNIISIPDLNLRSALEKALGKNEGDAITKGDLAAVSSLSVPSNAKVDSLQGLQYCTSLSALRVQNNNTTDLSPLKGLVNLTGIDIRAENDSQSRIDDLTFVKDLTNLTRLALFNHHIQDLSPLMKLTSLTTLALSSNRVKDLEPLRVLTNLEYLSLDSNYIDDLSPLKDFKNYHTLNSVQDLASLEGLVELTYLNLEGNRLRDLIPLKDLTNLNTLYLNDNQITNLSPLSQLTGLKELNLNVNRIINISPLHNLPLRKLNLRDNRITDIAPLLQNGGISNNMYLEGNPLSDESIVTHIPALIASGIKVEFEAVIDANHFFSKSEESLIKFLNKYIKKESALY